MEHEHWYLLAFKVIFPVQPGLRMTARIGKEPWQGKCHASHREKATGPKIKSMLGPQAESETRGLYSAST